jgi:hypothetical protein
LCRIWFRTGSFRIHKTAKIHHKHLHRITYTGTYLHSKQCCGAKKIFLSAPAPDSFVRYLKITFVDLRKINFGSGSATLLHASGCYISPGQCSCVQRWSPCPWRRVCPWLPPSGSTDGCRISSPVACPRASASVSPEMMNIYSATIFATVGFASTELRLTSTELRLTSTELRLTSTELSLTLTEIRLTST